MKVWTEIETRPFETVWRAGNVIKVVDGDTFDLLIDLGYDVATTTRVRLMGEGGISEGGRPASVDAYETRGEEREQGLAATRRACELLTGAGPGDMDLKLLKRTAIGRRVRVFSARGGSRGKYGRWLSVLLVPSPAVMGAWISLGDVLLAEGHADDPGY